MVAIQVVDSGGHTNIIRASQSTASNASRDIKSTEQIPTSSPSLRRQLQAPSAGEDPAALLDQEVLGTALVEKKCRFSTSQSLLLRQRLDALVDLWIRVTASKGAVRILQVSSQATPSAQGLASQITTSISVLTVCLFHLLDPFMHQEFVLKSAIM